MRYGKMPKAGEVLVHNHVQHGPDTHHGIDGFRYWAEPLNAGLEVCACGWRPSKTPGSIALHYRVAPTHAGVR
jgi:hypothetical protein